MLSRVQNKEILALCISLKRSAIFLAFGIRVLHWTYYYYTIREFQKYKLVQVFNEHNNQCSREQRSQCNAAFKRGNQLQASEAHHSKVYETLKKRKLAQFEISRKESVHRNAENISTNVKALSDLPPTRAV